MDTIVNYSNAYMIKQIERLFFRYGNGDLNGTTKSKANRRLSKLCDHDFLDRIYQPVTTSKSPAVYTLGQSAYPVLKKVLGPDRKDLVYKRRNNKVEWMFLDHVLGISEFRVNLELSLNISPSTRLLFWERESKELNDKVNDPTGEGQYLTVTPDAFFGLKTESGKHYFFLEIDRGTEPLHRFTRKIIAYKAYWKSGKYTARYSFNHFRVLSVTESDRRLANLMEATIKVGGKNMFLFTTLEETLEDSPLGDIWVSTVVFDPRTLID